MYTVCQNCGAGLDTPYVLLGAAIECLSCNEHTIPRVPTGALYPDTGYEITFADFQRLVSDPADRLSVIPLLRQWYGYELEESGDTVYICSPDGKEVNSLSLHLRIQEDSPKQQALYRTAMTLWR
jgi:hypothetical protein